MLTANTQQNTDGWVDWLRQDSFLKMFCWSPMGISQQPPTVIPIDAFFLLIILCDWRSLFFNSVVGEGSCGRSVLRTHKHTHPDLFSMFSCLPLVVFLVRLVVDFSHSAQGGIYAFVMMGFSWVFPAAVPSSYLLRGSTHRCVWPALLQACGHGKGRGCSREAVCTFPV